MSKPKFPGAERRFQSSNQSSRLAKQRRQDLSDDLSFPVAAKRSRKGLYNKYGVFVRTGGPAVT